MENLEMLIELKNLAVEHVNRLRSRIDETVKTGKESGLEFSYMEGYSAGIRAANGFYYKLFDAMDEVAQRDGLIQTVKEDKQ